MCGGRMFNVPCSRVGHVYRDKVPYKSNKLNAALINFKRVAEVFIYFALMIVVWKLVKYFVFVEPAFRIRSLGGLGLQVTCKSEPNLKKGTLTARTYP